MIVEVFTLPVPHQSQLSPYNQRFTDPKWNNLSKANNMPITFSILERTEYDAEYKKAFTPVEVSTDSDKDQLRDAIQTTQQLIVDALAAKWKKEDDYQVGWDFNYCYHVCGGIYSDSILCPDYLDSIAAALANAPDPSKWTYHTACEAGGIYGEFFIRNGVAYLPDDSDPELLAKLGATP